MKCKKCGFELQDGISFCPHCGSYNEEQNNFKFNEFDNSNEYNPFNDNRGFSSDDNYLNNNQVNNEFFTNGNYVSNNHVDDGFGSDKGFTNNDYLINRNEPEERPQRRQFISLESKEDRKGNKKDLIICLVVLAVWIVLIYVMINNLGKKDYYFEGTNETELVDVPVPTVPETPKTEKEKPSGTTTDFPDIGEGVSKSGYNGIATSSDKSRVVFDRQYVKKGNLSSKSDVLKYVQADNSKNKSNCPSDMVSLEENMENRFQITAVNFCEMDRGLANELKNVAEFVYNKYPNARGYMTNFTVATVAEDATYMAAFMPMFTFVKSNTSTGYPIGLKSQIILNTKYFLNLGKVNNSVSYGVRTGYFPRNATPSTTVAHEFGHYLSYVAMLNYYKQNDMIYIPQSKSNLMFTIYNDFNAGDFSKKVLEDAYAQYKKSYGSSQSFDQFRASISSYAVAKDSSGNYIYDETIAEAFHDYYINGNGAAPASRVIMQELEKYL